MYSPNNRPFLPIRIHGFRPIFVLQCQAVRRVYGLPYKQQFNAECNVNTNLLNMLPIFITMLQSGKTLLQTCKFGRIGLKTMRVDEWMRA